MKNVKLTIIIIIYGRKEECAKINCIIGNEPGKRRREPGEAAAS